MTDSLKFASSGGGWPGILLILIIICLAVDIMKNHVYN